MNYIEWARKWPEAASELLELVGAGESEAQHPGMSEASVQQRIRLQHQQTGGRLWRNNSGVLTDTDGRPVRYGLANDSSKINKLIKSSDLIGITPVNGVGVFTAVEVKKGDWKFSGSDRELAQLRFIMLVQSMGGIGRFQR
jgi:hypothetical protein